MYKHPDHDLPESEWRNAMLYQQRFRTDLTNESRYLGWLRVSLAMITLGFVVERVDLVLARMTDTAKPEVIPMLRWAPLLIFGIGGVMIAVATWEFFADRKRIGAGEERQSTLLRVLILTTLAAVIVIAVLLLLPWFQ